MDFHDIAIKHMLNNLGSFHPNRNTFELFTEPVNNETFIHKGHNMNISPMYGCSFNSEDENKKNIEKASADKYEVFRKNHFEVFITDPVESKAYDDLRLCAYSIDVNLYSGKIVFKVYATKNTLEIISKLRPHQKLNLKYMMYNPDNSNKFVAYDDAAYIEDIIFSSKYEIDKTKENSGEIVTLLLKSRDLY